MSDFNQVLPTTPAQVGQPSPGAESGPIRGFPIASSPDPPSGSSRTMHQPSTSPSRGPRPLATIPSSFPSTYAAQPNSSMIDALDSRPSSPVKIPRSSLVNDDTDMLATQLPATIPTSDLIPSGSSHRSDDVDMADEDEENVPPMLEGEEEGEEGEEGDSEEEDEDEEDDEDEEEDEDDAGSEDLEGDEELRWVSGGKAASPSAQLLQVKTEPGEPAEAGPSTLPADAPAAAEGEAVNTLVPKKKRPRRRSPSEEDNRPPPPPLQTIRLERAIVPNTETTATMEWDVYESATALGLVMRRWNTDAVDGLLLGPSEPTTAPTLDLGTLAAGELSAEEIARRLDAKWNTAGPAKKKAKIKRKDLDYDFEDPFIDDSELQQDAPTHMAKTVKEGFFVHQGKVEVQKEEAAKPSRPRPTAPRRHPRTSQAGPAKPARQRKSLAQLVSGREKKVATNGSAGSPIKVDSDEESEAGPSSPYMRTPSPEPVEDLAPMPVDRSLFPSAPRDASLLPPWADYPKEVREKLRKLREKSLQHPWDPKQKNKFPDEFKPLVRECGRAAFHNKMFELADDEDSKFFHALPSVLPYNTFTLTKLTTKLCHDEYSPFLEKCETAGLKQLKLLVEKDFDENVRKFEEAQQKYEVDKAQWDEEHPPDDTPSVLLNPVTSANMAIDLSNEPGDDDENPQPTQANEGPRAPIKRFTWSAEMQEVFGQLLDNTQDMLELNKKANEWRIPNARFGKEYTESNMKSALYKKIVEVFPEGWISGRHVSNEASKIKKKKKASKKSEATQVDA